MQNTLWPSESFQRCCARLSTQRSVIQFGPGSSCQWRDDIFFLLGLYGRLSSCVGERIQSTGDPAENSWLRPFTGFHLQPCQMRSCKHLHTTHHRRPIGTSGGRGKSLQVSWNYRIQVSCCRTRVLFRESLGLSTANRRLSALPYAKNTCSQD